MSGTAYSQGSVIVPGSAEELILAVTFDPSSRRYAVIRDGLIIGRYGSYVRALEVLEGDQGDQGDQEEVVLADVRDRALEANGVVDSVADGSGHSVSDSLEEPQEVAA